MKTSFVAFDNNDNDQIRCCICGVSEEDASNLTQSQLQTNATVGCGHQFCSSCVERELARRTTFPCPVCETPVKRVTLSTRTLDDVQCEKDTSWRKRIVQVYNKVQSDFPSLKEYNDYLEEVEEIIYCIVNEEPNAEEMKTKVKEYEEQNKTQIVVRQSQRADEERTVADRIMQEKRDAERRKQDYDEEERFLAKAKRKMRQEATEVMLGDREEMSAEMRTAQMQGYRNELRRQHLNRKTAAFAPEKGPLVREPKNGLQKEQRFDRERNKKRQVAGGGIDGGNLASLERCWILSEDSLFAHIPVAVHKTNQKQ